MSVLGCFRGWSWNWWCGFVKAAYWILYGYQRSRIGRHVPNDNHRIPQTGISFTEAKISREADRATLLSREKKSEPKPARREKDRQKADSKRILEDKGVHHVQSQGAEKATGGEESSWGCCELGESPPRQTKVTGR